MAKFLYLNSRRFMMGFLARHCHQIRPVIPATNRKQKMRMKVEANQSFSSPLSSIICMPPMATVSRLRPM